MKRLFTIVVAIYMLLLFSVQPHGDLVISINQLQDAEMCYEMGLIIGNGNGVDASYLDSDALRIQSAVIMLRLVGLEDEMLAFDYKGKPNFSDVSSNGYEQRLLAYLYEHKELGWVGNGSNEFNPDAPLTAKELTKVLLVSLGYKQEVDYEWQNVFEFAEGVGINNYSKFDNPELKVADVCELIVEVLTKLTADQEMLVEKLIKLGVVDKKIAVSYDLIRADLSVEYVDVESSYELKVYLNVPIDEISTNNIIIPDVFIQDVKIIDEEGKIIEVHIEGTNSGWSYPITISGAKYAYTIQSDATYVFEAK